MNLKLSIDSQKEIIFILIGIIWNQSDIM